MSKELVCESRIQLIVPESAEMCLPILTQLNITQCIYGIKNITRLLGSSLFIIVIGLTVELKIHTNNAQYCENAGTHDCCKLFKTE